MQANPKETPSPTKLNVVQQQLLRLFSREMGDQELAEIQNLLTDYYDNRLQDSFDKVWEEKEWDVSIFDNFLNEHMRTPYGKQSE
ncbi:MAG: hypothetical protein WA960_23130 [Tunicatimonas sp.]